MAPLYIACEKGHLEVARMLLSADGIEPNPANAYNQTPVNIASYNGYLEVVRLLLSCPRLDITTEDKWGDVLEASRATRPSRPSSESTPPRPTSKRESRPLKN